MNQDTCSGKYGLHHRYIIWPWAKISLYINLNLCESHYPSSWIYVQSLSIYILFFKEIFILNT